MSTLREISAQHQELALLVEREEFSAEDVKDTFEALEGELSVKAASLVAVVNNMKADTDVIDAEIKRLQARKKTMVNKQESLRDYLKFNMQSLGITNIKCPLFSITLAKGRDMVQVDDPSQIPEDYKEIVETVKIDKVGLLRGLKAGPLPGATLVKSDESLRIK